MYACTHVLLYSCTHVLMYSCTYVLMYSRTYILMYSCTQPAIMLPLLGLRTVLRTTYCTYLIPKIINQKSNTPTEYPLHPHPGNASRHRGRQCHPGSSSQHHLQFPEDMVSAPPRQIRRPHHIQLSVPWLSPRLSRPRLTGPMCAAAAPSAASAAATLVLSPGCKACCCPKPAGCYTQGN